MSSDEKEGAKRYNGWANYETWCVHLWMSNEQGSYGYWRGEARKQRSEAPSCANVERGIWGAEDAAKFGLADQMKGELEALVWLWNEEGTCRNCMKRAVPTQKASLFSDLLSAALSEVDWHEVAEAFLEELEPEEPEPSDDDQEHDEEETSTTEEPKGPLFSLGQVVSTPGALAALSREDIDAAIRRHVSGDWGEVSEADRTENDLSVREGFRVLSEYRGQNDCRFWVITEADRSSTTVLLPEEY